jgi:hypothetical protein
VKCIEGHFTCEDEQALVNLRNAENHEGTVWRLPMAYGMTLDLLLGVFQAFDLPTAGLDRLSASAEAL